MTVRAAGGRLRILMISHGYPPTFGGVESHVWDLGHRFVDRGHQVRVIAGGRGLPTPGVVPVHRYDAVSVQALVEARVGRPRSGPANGHVLAAIRAILAAECASFVPDLIHVHNPHHYGPELAQACLDLGTVPVINGVHDRVGEHLYPDVLDWGWAAVVYASDYLHRALPTTRPALVRLLAIDLDQFRPNGPRDSRMGRLPRPIIFHPARLLRWKGVDCGVRAFAAVHRDLGGSLVLCASDDIVDDPRQVASFRRELVTLAGELGVGDSVHFMSFDRPAIPAAYRAADLIWYPTIEEEPLGLAPLEAMACGIPLVVTRSGGMQETVVEGETGLVVPRREPQLLAAAARTILTDGTLRSALVRQGITRAARFGLDGYVDWLEACYQSVAGRTEVSA